MSMEWTWDSAGRMAGLAMLADAAAKGTVLLALAWFVTVALRKSSAAVRHWVWVTAMAGLVVLPLLGAALPGWRVLPRWTGGEESSRVVPARLIGITTIVLPVDTPAGPAEMPGKPPLRVSGPLVVALVWGAGVAGMLVPMGLGMIWLRRLRRKSEPMSAEWTGLLEKLKASAGVNGPVELRQSARCVVPLTYGIWRPVMVVPAEATGWPEQRRRMALLHELAHIRRRDCLTQWMAQWVRACYWFHPLAWVAVARAQAECERACDDRVLGVGMRPSSYAEVLMEYAAPLSHRAVPVGALAMARASTLKGRLMAILDSGRNRRGVTWRVGVGVLAVVAGGTVSLAMMHGKQAEATQPASFTFEARGVNGRVQVLVDADSVEESKASDGVIRTLMKKVRMDIGGVIVQADECVAERRTVEGKPVEKVAAGFTFSGHVIAEGVKSIQGQEKWRLETNGTLVLDLETNMMKASGGTLLRSEGKNVSGDMIMARMVPVASATTASGPATARAGGAATNVAPGQATVEHVQLLNSRAADVARLVNAMFRPTGRTPRPIGRRMASGGSMRIRTSGRTRWC